MLSKFGKLISQCKPSEFFTIKTLSVIFIYSHFKSFKEILGEKTASNKNRLSIKVLKYINKHDIIFKNNTYGMHLSKWTLPLVISKVYIRTSIYTSQYDMISAYISLWNFSNFSIYALLVYVKKPKFLHYPISMFRSSIRNAFRI